MKSQVEFCPHLPRRETGVSSKYIDHIRPMGLRVRMRLLYHPVTAEPVTLEAIEIVDNGRAYPIRAHLVVKRKA